MDTAGLGKAPSASVGLTELGEEMEEVQMNWTVQTQGSLYLTVSGSVYHQALNREHLLITVQSGFMHLLLAKNEGKS